MQLLSFLSELNLDELHNDTKIAVAQFCNATLDYQYGNEKHPAIAKDTRGKSFVPKKEVTKTAGLQEQLNKTIAQRNELAAMLDAALGDDLPGFLRKWKPSDTLMDAPFDSLMGK